MYHAFNLACKHTNPTAQGRTYFHKAKASSQHGPNHLGVLVKARRQACEAVTLPWAVLNRTLAGGFESERRPPHVWSNLLFPRTKSAALVTPHLLGSCMQSNLDKQHAAQSTSYYVPTQSLRTSNRRKLTMVEQTREATKTMAAQKWVDYRGSTLLVLHRKKGRSSCLRS